MANVTRSARNGSGGKAVPHAASRRAPSHRRTAPVPAPGAFLESVANSMRQAMVALDGRRKIVRSNRAFERMFGTAGQGEKLRDLFNPKGLSDLLKQAALKGEPVREVEMEDISRGLAYVVTAAPVSEPGTNARMLLLIDDVTASTEQRHRVVANSRLVSVGEMAAGVAHELNNPLTAVLGFSQLALRQDVDDVLRRDLEAIATEAERAGRIVDNLLSFARTPASPSDVFDTAASIQKILDLREYECRVNNIEVVTYFDPSAPKTRAAGHRMEQVFLNLLSNSIQAITDGPGRGTITVGLVAIDDRIRISFTDDGPGIPPEILGRVFDPFFTTKPVGKGTGLGLNICQGIVRDHGGDIRVESHPRRGTTFVVELPVVAVDEADVEESPAPEAVNSSYTMLRILAVDDEPAVTELLGRALGGLGHDVDTARDGAEALRLIHLTDYDAILLDIKMPGLGGPEVFRCIDGLRPDLKGRVLFITGDTVSPDTRLFAESADVKVLHKPFSLEELRRHMDGFAIAKDRRISALRTGSRPDLGAGLTRITRK
ncbi:MAG: ATP-binding protein [Dehalococcoidia bacterium]